MFNPNEFVIGGVLLIPMVFGLTEFLKSVLPIEGKNVTILSFALGLVLYFLNALSGYLPGLYAEIYNIFVQGLTIGLTASGFYKFAAARMVKTSDFNG